MEHAFSKKNCVQFVSNGPHLPVRLLQAHEDGRVVFFCGAGISMPKLLTKLNPLARSKPLNFASLVDSLYTEFGVTPNPRQERAIEAGQYDIAVGLLEPEIVGGREEVRRALSSILTDQTKPNMDTAHGYLLELSKNRDDGGTRLVTTNFDRLFEDAIKVNKLQVECFYAPLLPIPNKQWDGLVYLHGFLPEKPTLSKLNNLVVSSGDFGRAYLTERWASRFVRELFRNYSVCFVGYSLNDPVLRYMTDAIAADRQQGESAPEIFAFGGYSEGKEEEEYAEWKDKNVIPILHLKDSQQDHLRKTLQAWSKTYRKGVPGKEDIVAECAKILPTKSTREDDFVSRVLWALSDPSGLPAKRFAKLDPVPSFDWLEPLCEMRYNHTDLGSSSIPTIAGFHESDTFSLLHRPSPSASAPYIALVSTEAQNGEWDAVMFQLVHWLTLHLSDPALLLWVANLDGSPHHNLADLIESRLDKLSEPERAGNRTDLKRIFSNEPNAPNAIPLPMQTLWHLLLAGHMSSGSRGTQSRAFAHWQTHFKRHGLTKTSPSELRKLLTPHVTLWPAIDSADSEPKRIKDLVGWEIVMFEHEVLYGLNELTKDKLWIEASPKLLTEFSSLLHDTLELMRKLGSENDRIAPTFVLSPSISEHKLNTGLNDWTPLINLTCNAWLFTAKQSPEQARCAAEAWSQESYPLFRRLAFFAAAQGKTISSSQGLDWLLADDHRWLWATETKWETISLLDTLAPQLTKDEIAELEKAILNGPPSATLENYIDHKHQTNSADSDIWLRLVEIDQAGATLSKDGREKLAELYAKRPDWKDESDKTSSQTNFNLAAGDNFDTTLRRRDLVKWLKRHPDDRWGDGWQRRCHNNFPATACALCALAKMGNWPADRWSVALQVWSEEKLSKRSWRYMAPVLANALDEQLQPFALEFSRWLRTIAKTFVGQDEIFLKLCQRVLNLKYEEGAGSYSVPRNHGRLGGNDFLACAINHPIGSATQALLNWCFRGAPKDVQDLPDELEPTFTMLCDRSFDKFRHGRVLLAAYLKLLFRVDRDWATKHLLPLFDWQTCEIEACAAWQGFLWSPGLQPPLMEALWPSLLETASHYEALAKYDKGYVSLLTLAALYRGYTFETKDLAVATRKLPPDGLQYAAQELVRGLEGDGKRRANYWKNRAEPYLRKIWPKTLDRISPDVTNNLGSVCIAAQEAFPEAFELLQPWLQLSTDPSGYHDHYHYVLLQKLHKTKICSKFPEQALNFLDLVIPKRPCWIPEELGTCLKAIHSAKSADPELERDVKYQRLMERVREQEAD